MNMEQHPWTPTRVMIATVLVELPSVCMCGQDLDVCSGTHCPRCGTSVSAHAA
jgi:hypothetical protein